MDNQITRKNDRIPPHFNQDIDDRLFSEDSMYKYLERTAGETGLSSTIRVLPLMRDYHKGQTRKGPDNIPFINHPLLMACHALALGFKDDDIISAILLHDVCEDCDIAPDELPVNEIIRELVDILTYTELPGETEEQAHLRYYKRISENPSAALIKIIDRCNNIASMAAAFTPEHMLSYIDETQKYVLPLFDVLDKTKDETLKGPAFLLKYHLLSLLESDRHILELL